MRIILKPAGAGVILVIIAVMLGFVFWQSPRKNETGADKGIPLGNWGLTAEPGTGSLKTRLETLPGAGKTSTVYAVSCDKPVATPWHVSLSAATKAAVTKDEPLVIVFWARAPQSAMLTANFEETKMPFTKSVSRNVKVNETWREHSVPLRVAANYAVNGSQVTFHCSFQPGVVEIADVRLRRETK